MDACEHQRWNETNYRIAFITNKMIYAAFKLRSDLCINFAKNVNEVKLAHGFIILELLKNKDSPLEGFFTRLFRRVLASERVNGYTKKWIEEIIRGSFDRNLFELHHGTMIKHYLSEESQLFEYLLVDFVYMYITTYELTQRNGFENIGACAYCCKLFTSIKRGNAFYDLLNKLIEKCADKTCVWSDFVELKKCIDNDHPDARKMHYFADCAPVFLMLEGVNAD